MSCSRSVRSRPSKKLIALLIDSTQTFAMLWFATVTASDSGLRRLPLQACKGRRLKPESLAVTVANHNIAKVCVLSISNAISFFDGLDLTEREQLIARGVL